MRPAIAIHTAEVLPPRAVLFLGIVAVHALLAYFLGNGLVRTVKNFITPPVEVIPIKDRLDVPVPQERLDPALRDPIYVPPSEVPGAPIDYEADSITTTSVEPTPYRPPVGPSAIAEPPPLRLIGRNVIPNSESYYPAQDRRLGREGTAEVQACVSPQGVLSSTPTVERSSGRMSLDQAAVRLVGDGRFARAVRGSEPVPNCYRFRVSFTMQR
jgi:TonB family protein